VTESEELLKAMARDESVQASVRLAALNELAKLDPPAPAAPADAEAAMAALVARLCPEGPEMTDAAPDPMRDLEAAEQLRLAGKSRAVDASIWTWLPFRPERVAEAERLMLQAMRRLGLAAGPLPPPGERGDELSAPRDRRGKRVA
jgi:hypothetical protein